MHLEGKELGHEFMWVNSVLSGGGGVKLPLGGSMSAYLMKMKGNYEFRIE